VAEAEFKVLVKMIYEGVNCCGGVTHPDGEW
jgi:hypothetical protein